MSYEFNKEDEQEIKAISTSAILIAILISLGGFLGIIGSFTTYDLGTQGFGFSMTQNLIQVLSGLLYIPAALAFRRVTTTTGKDISELLDGIDKMATAFFIIIVLIIFSIAIDIYVIFSG